MAVNQKKRGTRVADLEIKLTQAREELQKLKEQLASTEAAKIDAQQELEEAKKRIPIPPKEEEEEEEEEATMTDSSPLPLPATDVFEVVPPTSIPTDPLPTHVSNEDNINKEDDEEEVEVEKEEVETKTVTEDDTNEEGSNPEEEIQVPNSSELVIELTANLAEKEKEIETLATENESLKKQAEEATKKAEAARVNEDELGLKLANLEKELRHGRANTDRLSERLEAAEGTKTGLEAEMKRLRVQTEQWRKAAEAAAAVLAAGDGAGNWRCGSMEKQRIGGYEIGNGGELVGSPMMGGGEVEEEGMGGGAKRRGGGGGIRMFGELWKKRGQQNK